MSNQFRYTLWLTLAMIDCRIWGGILTGVAIPQIALARAKDRKIIAVGLTRLLTECPAMLAEPYAKTW